MPADSWQRDWGTCMARTWWFWACHEGGVPVAFEVAEALDAPLDVIVVRKLGVPFQPELAMGAIGEGGVRVLDAEVLARAQVTEEELRTAERRERGLLEARVARLRRGRVRVNLDGRIAVIVDDGIATGSTARVACGVARHLGAAKVVLGVPVAPAETVRDLAEADEVVFVSVPRRFMAVGYHYPRLLANERRGGDRPARRGRKAHAGRPGGRRRTRLRYRCRNPPWCGGPQRASTPS